MAIIFFVLLLVIIIGVIYSLWQSTRAYGGVIGAALKWVGVGILFFTIEALDRIFETLGSVSFVNMTGVTDPVVLHHVLMFLGLLFSGIGFSRLTRAAK